MTSHRILTILFIVALTILSGISDAQGFVHASSAWSGGKILWSELVKSLIGFSIGAVSFIIAANYLRQVGIASAEIQTIIWFVITIVGVAVVSGKFLHWPGFDQILALVALVSIGWLVIRASA